MPRMPCATNGSTTSIARAIVRSRCPSTAFLLHPLLAEHAYAVVHDELMLDGNARMNLATFCQTWVEPEVHRLMDECLDKNIVDKDEYPQTAEIEARSVHMLADLWNSPTADNTIGCSTTGSSEAAMLAGLALKWRWRDRRRAAGKSAERPNLVCGPVQVCWHKFARYFDIELRECARQPKSGSAHILATITVVHSAVASATVRQLFNPATFAVSAPRFHPASAHAQCCGSPVASRSRRAIARVSREPRPRRPAHRPRPVEAGP